MTTTEIQKVQDLITNYHDENLIIPEGNQVYTLYEDGELTIQKGGSLYGRRTEHVVEYGLDKYSIYYKKLTFPKYTSMAQSYGYLLIATYEKALEIRECMKTLCRQQAQ